MRPLADAFPDVYRLKDGVRPGITKVTFSPPPTESPAAPEPETELDSTTKVRARVGCSSIAITALLQSRNSPAPLRHPATPLL